MPELSRFLGIIIYMYFNDHAPPHFHAEYNEYKASIAIESLGILEGKLPSKVLSLVVEWAAETASKLGKYSRHRQVSQDFSFGIKRCFIFPMLNM